MSLSVAWRLARRELRGGLGGFRIFLLCLALGVGAIAAVGSVRAAIEGGLAREGRALLGGDAELRMTYRFADAAERAWLDAHSTRWAEVVDFRSMAVTGGGDRALTQVKAVDDAWPLVGAAQFDPVLPGAAMDPVLIDRLGLALGDHFRLGTQDFVLMAAVLREPDTVSSGFGFGPRTLVAHAALEGSGLIGPGSLFDTSYRLTLREGDTLQGVRASLIANQGELLAEGRLTTLIRTVSAFGLGVATMDVRVGGDRLVEMRMPTPDDEMSMWFGGEHREVSPALRLAYSEAMTDASGRTLAAEEAGLPSGHPVLTEVTVELAAVDAGTHLTLTHAGIPADSPGATGWAMALDKLVAALEGDG